MAKDATRIIACPADVTLYDSSNGYLLLGYMEDVRLRAKPRTHTTVDGNLRQYGTEYDLQITMLQSDPAMLADIINRRSTQQTIYIVGGGCMVTMSNMYVAITPNYEFSYDKPHVLNLQAKTHVENDVTKSLNLLGNDGRFENDTNSDGLADGWVQIDMTSVSIVTSWRTGNAQRVQTSAAGPVLYYDKICPFHSPMRITFSVYARSSGTAGNVRPAFYLLDSSGFNIFSSTGSYATLSAGVEQRISHTAMVYPTSEVRTIRVQLAFNTNGQTIDFDDAQLELNVLSNYTEY